MRMRLLLLTSVALMSLALAKPASAQGPAPVPLETFIKEVAYLWSGNDARALVELMPAEARVLFDTGRGTESVQLRNVAAALRALFSDRESVSVRLMRVAVTQRDSPQRGFGELAWSFRARGAPSQQASSIYVGVVWTDEGWRISELRLIP